MADEIASFACRIKDGGYPNVSNLLKAGPDTVFQTDAHLVTADDDRVFVHRRVHCLAAQVKR
jgi:hypothetical protein